MADEDVLALNNSERADVAEAEDAADAEAPEEEGAADDSVRSEAPAEAEPAGEDAGPSAGAAADDSEDEAPAETEPAGEEPDDAPAPGSSGGAADDNMSEDEMEPGDFEATVPEEWQRVMSTKTLREATPLPLNELLQAIGSVVQGKVQADAAEPSSQGSMPAYTWQWASTTHGSHKLAELSLASIVKGVEAGWSSHAAVRLFGELNGMLGSAHDEALNHKVLGVLASAELCDLDAIGDTLCANGTVGADLALAALVSLNLTEMQMERLEGLVEADPRLDALLVATVQPVRENLADAAQGAAAEVGDEEPADRPAEEPAEKEEAEEEAAEEEEPRSGAAVDRVSAALDWASVVAKLPIGAADKEARGTLFDSCTENETLDLEMARGGMLRHLKVDAAASGLLSPAIERGFALAAELGSRAGRPDGAGADALGRWGFLLLVVYLRHYVELLMTLDRLTAADASAPVNEDDFQTACGKVRDWGVAVDEPEAEYEALTAAGELSFEAFAAWCLEASLEVVASNGDAAAADEEAVPRAEEPMLPPAEPLDPVFEQTERSFEQSALGSVRKGFFDASTLETTDEEPAGSAELRAKLAAAMEQVEKLNGKKEEAERKMGTVLAANESMQKQLKELNTVVEGVVKRELQRVKAMNTKAGGRNRSPTKFGR